MDVLSHALLPLLVLLAVGVRPARAAFALPFALLPDADALLAPHRATLHNVFAVALAAAAVLLVARHALGRADAPGLAALALFGGVSHLALDLPTGVALLHPLTLAAPHVSLQLYADFGSAFPLVFPMVEVGWSAAPPAFGGPPVLARPAATAVVVVANWGVMLVGLAALAFAMFGGRIVTENQRTGAGGGTSPVSLPPLVLQFSVTKRAVATEAAAPDAAVEERR